MAERRRDMTPTYRKQIAAAIVAKLAPSELGAHVLDVSYHLIVPDIGLDLDVSVKLDRTTVFEAKDPEACLHEVGRANLSKALGMIFASSPVFKGQPFPFQVVTPDAIPAAQEPARGSNEAALWERIRELEAELGMITGKYDALALQSMGISHVPKS
jgi:hypothetical protein